MTTVTPHADHHTGLGPLASRYVEVDDLPWTPTKFAGFEIKVLMENKETGLLTALLRCAPGARLPYHEHTDIEQTFVLDRKSTRLNSSHTRTSRMPSSA